MHQEFLYTKMFWQMSSERKYSFWQPNNHPRICLSDISQIGRLSKWRAYLHSDYWWSIQCCQKNINVFSVQIHVQIIAPTLSDAIEETTFLLSNLKSKIKRIKQITKVFFCNFLKNPHQRISSLILEREEGRERERERERKTSISCLPYTPDHASNP